jgi:erythromycin esterase
MVTPSFVRALVALVVLSVAACARPGPSGAPVVAAHPAASAAPSASPFAIEGTVSGADGRPASGAIVGVEPLGNATYPLPAPKVAVAGADGHYRLELGAGSYALTATSRAGGRAYEPKVDVSANGPARADLTLGGDASVLRGTVRDRHGAPVAGAVVECARVISDDTGILFFTITDASGAFVVALGSGRYWVAPWSAAGTSDVVTKDVPPPGQDTQADFVVMPQDPPGPGPAEVVAWMRDHAVRLSTVEARHGFDDMQPIGAMVGDAHIVALGEATHGTREFFQMKHRMLEYLVTEKGFTAFAIEASMPEAFDVDAYVLGGPGDATKALDALYFWTINTEEVLDLIEWMRAYNLDPAHTRKVHFYGFDMQSPARAAKRALAYVRKVDPAYGAKAGAALARAADALLATDWSSELGERAALAASAREVLATFDARRDAWTAKTGAAAFELARQYARVVSQGLDSQAASVEPSWAGSAKRDVAMADNVDWLLARNPGEKIVLWAHNAHVETVTRATAWGGCCGSATGATWSSSASPSPKEASRRATTPARPSRFTGR